MILDIVTVLCIGLGHIYLFHLLLADNKMSMFFMIAIALFITVFLAIALYLTSLVELNVIVMLVFLIVLGILYKKHTIPQVVYYALLSIVVFTGVQNSVYLLFYTLYMESPLNYYVWSPSVIGFVTVVFILSMLFVLKKYIRAAGNHIIHSKLYYLTYGIVVICTVCIMIVNYPTTTFFAKANEMYGDQLYAVILLVVMLLLLTLTIRMYIEKRRLIEQHAQTEYEQLMAYVEKLEFLHDELASFRHDYTNLLLSLEEAIQQQDLAQVKQIYSQTIAPTVSVMNLQQLELTKLARIELLELKSMLSVKVLAAQRQSITVNLDIPNPISTFSMPSDHLLRIFSVLVDNALEASAKSKAKTLQIALFEIEQTQYIIVQNSIDREVRELLSIFEKSVSSKGEKRGIGLYSVRRLLNKHPHLTLKTQYDDAMFTQELIIQKNNRL